VRTPRQEIIRSHCSSTPHSLAAPKRRLQQRDFEVNTAKKLRFDQDVGVDAVRDIETQLRHASQAPLCRKLSANLQPYKTFHGIGCKEATSPICATA